MKKEILNCIEKYRVLRTYWTALIYCVKENNNAEIYFAFFFPFLAHLSYAQDEL